MEIRVAVNCCFCFAEHESFINIPNGWSLRYSEILEEDAFCPEHSGVVDWISSVCPGCVGSWGDCSLWQDFAYGKKNLSDQDFEKIKCGICPRRTNGTITLDSKGPAISMIDLSEQATTESGEATAKAILDYWNNYQAD